MVNLMNVAEGVVDEPSPSAFVHEFGDSSINFAVNFWHASGIADEWTVRHGVALARPLHRRGAEAVSREGRATAEASPSAFGESSGDNADGDGEGDGSGGNSGGGSVG